MFKLYDGHDGRFVGEPGFGETVAAISHEAGARINSHARSQQAAALLHSIGQHTQAEVIELHARGVPGFGPANPVNRTTHCRYNDGIAYSWWPPGFRIPIWARGIDTDSPAAFCAVARRHGILATPTYPGSRGEAQHVNLRRAPTWRPTLPPLRGGDRGLRVRRLVGNLQWLGYLPWPTLGRPLSRYGGWVNTAVARFQHDYHLHVDSIAGPATLHAIAVAIRARSAAGWHPSRRPPLAALHDHEPGPTAREHTISSHGVEFIAGFEGFVARPEPDPVGYCTVGYGHLIRYGPCTAADRARFGTLTRQTALELLHRDLARVEADVRRLVHVPLTQGQFDALVSFTFNLGAGALAGSTLLRELNARNYAGARGQFGRWVHAGGRTLPGLVRRRREEAAMFH